MIPSPHKVASRYRLSSASPQELMLELQNLEDLDESLTEFSEHFNARFAATGLDPEVKNQVEARAKAVKGYNSAVAIEKSALLLQDIDPEARDAALILKKAQAMQVRFDRHIAAAEKIVKRIAKKEIPAQLKKAASQVKRVLTKYLENPQDLEIMYWVNPGDWGDKIAEYRLSFGVNTGKSLVGIELRQAIFGPRSRYPSDKVTMSGGTLSNLGRLDSGSQASNFDLKWAGEKFLELTRGWAGIKGEGAATVNRKKVSRDIADALNSAINRMRSWQSREAEVSSNFTSISGEYRSDLPKEGASEVGEYDYREMVREEIKHWRKVLDPYLKPYMKHIRSIEVQDGEKSWIYTVIDLK